VRTLIHEVVAISTTMLPRSLSCPWTGGVHSEIGCQRRDSAQTSADIIAAVASCADRQRRSDRRPSQPQCLKRPSNADRERVTSLRSHHRIRFKATENGIEPWSISPTPTPIEGRAKTLRWRGGREIEANHPCRMALVFARATLATDAQNQSSIAHAQRRHPRTERGQQSSSS